jgi:RNA polymerase sigma-70 factor (ECF subfamily)
VAEQTVLLGERARFAGVALVEGAVGAVVAPRGRLRLVLRVTVEDGRIASYEAIADPARLRGLALAVLDG